MNPQSVQTEADDRESAPSEVEQRLAPSASVVYQTVRHEGERELARSHSALAFSSFAAGLSMGFSFVSEALLQHYLPSGRWNPLISKLGYSVGFVIVVLGRQQLFTENTLTPVLPLLRAPTRDKLIRLWQLWLIVLAANLLGTFLFALAGAFSQAFPADLQATMVTMAQSKLGPDFATTFVRAILAGWLIALMVWLLPFAETARVQVIILLTYLIGLGHFSHVIAGSTDMFFLLFKGHLSALDLLDQFLIPTLLGNVVGGVLLVAVLNHAQVMPDET